MARWPAHKALDHWQKTGLLTPEKAKELTADLKAREQGHDSGRAVKIFATIGAVLVGLGVVLFVASNWSKMEPFTRVGVVFLAYCAAVAGASLAGRKELPKVANAAWLLVTLLLGANMAVIAQVFNHSLTFWQGPFLWMLGALALGYARQSPAQGAVAVPLGLLALGWMGGGSGWFFDDQTEFLFSSGGLRPIFPLLGIGLISIALLVRRRKEWGFAEAACLKWGTLLIAIPLIICTMHVELVEGFFEIDFTPKQIILLAGVVVLLILAVSLGTLRTPLTRPVLIGITGVLFLFMVEVDGVSWLSMEFNGWHLAYGFFVIAVFSLSLLSIFMGLRAQHGGLINLGIYSSAILIVIQYFSWSAKLMDRSIVFIVGGILLIGLSIFMEKKRRILLSRITP